MSSNGSESLINKTIFDNLVFNREYFVKVWGHLKSEHFEEMSPYRDLYNMIMEHYEEFKTPPSKNMLQIKLEESSLTEIKFDKLKTIVDNLEGDSYKNDTVDELIKITETHVKRTAFENTLVRCYEIFQNDKLPEREKNKKLPSLDSARQLMDEALGIDFYGDQTHDYIDDVDERIRYYSTDYMKIPFKLNTLNIMTNYGVERKTLNLIVAGTNVGKSLGLCSLSADYLMLGYNVLYVSMEMEKVKIGQRIDANLLDISLDQLNFKNFDSKKFNDRFDRIKNNENIGRLKVIDYPQKMANINTLRGLLEDLKTKEDFVPHIIMVDYLAIFDTVNANKQTKEHDRQSNVASDLRALAQEEDLVLWSAVQVNRDAYGSSDGDVSDIAGSFNVTHHADFMILITETHDLVERRMQRIKVIKSRYGNKDKNGEANVSVSKLNQRWVDLDEWKGSPQYIPPKVNPSSLTSNMEEVKNVKHGGANDIQKEIKNIMKPNDKPKEEKRSYLNEVDNFDDNEFLSDLIGSMDL